MKKILMGFLGIVVIFVSYLLLNPLDPYPSLASNAYSYKSINVSPDNTSATFKDQGESTFFIHPGLKKPTGVLFAFDQSADLLLDFSILKGSKVGDIEFTVLKNGKEIRRVHVTAQDRKDKQVKLSVGYRDQVGIWADKHGSTAADWGHLKIKAKEPLLMLKKFIIPFMWALLFVFLLGKRHYYIAINAYIGFILILLAEKLNFGSLSFYQILTYMLLLFAMTFLFTLIYQELSLAKRYKIATLVSYIVAMVLYAVPLSFIVYALNYHSPVTKDVLFAVFQSNPDESLEYISDYIALRYIALSVFVTSLVGFLLYRQEKKETLYIEKSLLIFLVLIFLSMVSVGFWQLRLPAFVKDAFVTYGYEVSQFKRAQAKRKSGEIRFDASKRESGETYIVIIGESLNKHHMGVYGYARETTPTLSKLAKEGKLLLFDNVYSNHTHTVFVLDYALTEANQYNGKKFYESLSIIDVLKKAGFETYWLTNQPIYSIYDNMVSVIGTSADHVVALNTAIGGRATATPKYDGALIEKVQKVLEDDAEKNRVLFVHLGGSHSTYAERYPKKTFTRFSGKIERGVLGEKAARVPTVNTYDNSVFYNDYVVGSILKLAQKIAQPALVLYMSDHAEDVISRLGHNSSMFTYQMTEIPMLMWMNEAYKKRYPDKYAALLAHNNRLFSNDLLYDTMIGIFGIETERYAPGFDLSAKSYSFDPDAALVLHGKKHYAEKSNYNYWQRVNSRYLVDHNLSSRVLPSEVNTIGKLKEIWHLGFRSFALSVCAVQEGDKTLLKVGRSPSCTGVSLDRYLKYIDFAQTDKIVLRLNIDDFQRVEAEKVLELLNRLDQTYHIKKSVVLMIDGQANFIHQYTASGWHVLHRVAKRNTQKEVRMDAQQVTQEIIKRIQGSDITDIAFDQSLYSWIKSYIIPQIDRSLKLYCDTDLTLCEHDFQTQIEQNSCYRDPQVETIFVGYKSQFDL